MATSLQKQLQRLSAPQTAELAIKIRQASVLFDSKDAATKSRRTIFEIGQSGLEELIRLNSSLKQFESTLFNEESINLERSVENRQVNLILDANITKFCRYLSPYFLLRPAQMCIEWLLRRYHAHEYNREALLEMALPYHETNSFVRLIQTFNIRKGDEQWLWLKPIQRPGVTLPKSTIINRAATENPFLRFICTSTVEAINELGTNAHLLQAQMKLYTVVTVGVLDAMGTVTENQVITILPSLLAGLKSNVVDFVSSSYIIMSQIIERAPLADKLCKAFVSKLINGKFSSLHKSVIILLVLIYKSPARKDLRLSDTNLQDFMRQPSLLNALAAIAASVPVSAFTSQLLHTAIAGIRMENSTPYKLFIDEFFKKVVFMPEDSIEMIKCILDCFQDSEICNGEATPNSAKDSSKRFRFEEWYAGLLIQIERQYPATFDLVVKECSRTNSSRKSALKIIAEYALRNVDSSSIDLYDQLYHKNDILRINAVRILVEKLGNTTMDENNAVSIKSCLIDRINDDCVEVVREVLKLKTTDFIQYLSMDEFMSVLVDIIRKVQNNSTEWLSLISSQVVRHLTSEQILQHYGPHRILLTLLPYLLPLGKSSEYVPIITEILRSPLSTEFGFLQDICECSKELLNADNFDIKCYVDNFQMVLARSPQKPDIIKLFHIAMEVPNIGLKSALNVSQLLLFSTFSMNKHLTNDMCLVLLKQACHMADKFKFINIIGKNFWTRRNAQISIPAYIFCDFLIALLGQLSYTGLSNWNRIEPDLECLLRIFNLVGQKVFELESVQPKSTKNLIWLNTLKEIFNIPFENNASRKIDFLLNFFINRTLPSGIVDKYPKVQLMAFRVLNSIVQKYSADYKITIANILQICAGLSNPLAPIRQSAIETLKHIKGLKELDVHLKELIQTLLNRQEEIAFDPNQVRMCLFFVMLGKGKGRKSMLSTSTLKAITSILKSNESFANNTQLLVDIINVVQLVDDEAIIDQLCALSMKCLNEYELVDDFKLLKEPYSEIIEKTVERLSPRNYKEMVETKPTVWQTLEQLIDKHDMVIVHPGSYLPLPCLAIKQLQIIFPCLSNKRKMETIKRLIKTITHTSHDLILKHTSRLIKEQSIDCSSFVEMIEEMYKHLNHSPGRLGKRKAPGDRAPKDPGNLLDSATWKEGIVLLELLENNTHLTGMEKLIPPLFELLRVCHEFSAQHLTKTDIQLVLSALQQCIMKAKNDGMNMQSVLPPSVFRVDLLVQCVRSSEKPQTQQNAVMLLAQCADIYPQLVLHNIVDIFTFMGNTFVRQDDLYSLHIINTVITTIIPKLVANDPKQRQGINSGLVNSGVIPVLKVFSDIMLDVPLHRQMLLYNNLLKTLGAERYLWVYLCVLFEAQVVDAAKNSGQHKQTKSTEKSEKRTEAAHQLTLEFEVPLILQTLIELVCYVKTLPVSVMETLDSNKSNDRPENSIPTQKQLETSEVTLFDVSCRSPKMLRHYTYAILQFLSTMSGSVAFLEKVVALSDKQMEEMRPLYQNLILSILSYVPMVDSALEVSLGSALCKYWKVIHYHVYTFLNNVLSQVKPTMFLGIMQSLLSHQIVSMRRMAIELLVKRLENEKDIFGKFDSEAFKPVLITLNGIVDTIIPIDAVENMGKAHSSSSSSSSQSNDMSHIQQNALIIIKLLSQMFGMTCLEEFKNVLFSLARTVKHRDSISRPMVASIVVTFVEVAANLKAHCLVHLPKFMYHLIQIMKQQVDYLQERPPDMPCLAILSSVQRLFVSLPLFLGPYVNDILTILCLCASRIQEQSSDSSTTRHRIDNAKEKIKSILVNMGANIPGRVLLICCGEAYDRLLQSPLCNAIQALMVIIRENICVITQTDVKEMHETLMTLFMKAIEFRLHATKHSMDTDDQSEDNQTDLAKDQIDTVEASIHSAAVKWNMKSTEALFLQFFYNIFEWAFKEHKGEKLPAIVYYRYLDQLGQELKSILLNYINEEFLQITANLLNENNAAKKSIDVSDKDMSKYLLTYILKCLNQIFIYDKSGTSTSRFEILLDPIVDHIDNELVLSDEPMQELLGDCICNMAASTVSDLLWKQLNYKVLLKTRNNNPQVRIFAFKCCVKTASILREEYVSLLPDAAQFIAELLEDENDLVESTTRKCVQELESFVGESVQSYIN